jgi:hypothetical protein
VLARLQNLVAERVSVSGVSRKPYGFRYQNRLRLLGLALGACVVTARTAEPLPHLRGVMAVGDVWLASFVVPEQQTQQWRRTGERFGDFTILTIDAQSVTLLDSQSVRQVVRLPESLVINRHAPPMDPAAWQRWVNSRDNPMLFQPAELPVSPRDWPQLPAAKRQEISDWYQAHGWKLTVAADASGDTAVEFAPLQSEQRHAILAQKTQTFLQALSPEQRTLHTAATSKLKNAAAGSETARGVFEASLPPLHREAFRLLGDFTAP